MRRLGKVKIKWSSAFAYAIGLLATDGNLSKDGRHLNLTSKDRAMIVTFKKCLGIQNKIGRKARSNSPIKNYFQVQFGDKNFYEFLINIGLTPAKSKTLGPLLVPSVYFADFLRGCIDGDGSIGVFRHPESSRPQLRIRLYSASIRFLGWIKREISKNAGIQTGWMEPGSGVTVLTYAKKDSIKLIAFIYYPSVEYYLKRKYNIAKPFMRV
jgi:hypothetical protein